MELVIAAVAAQIGIVGMLFRWMHTQIRDNRKQVDNMSKNSYSKEEAKEMVDMKLKPIEVGIQHLQEDLKEVKSMIGRLLDEKNNKN